MIDTENKVEATRFRSYIYELLANIYRQEPTAQLLAKFKDPEVLALLDEMRSDGPAKSEINSVPRPKGVPILISGTQSGGIHLEEELMSRPEAKLVEDLAIEYTQLFIGPGGHISPHESVFVDKEKMLWGETTAKVKRFIEGLGLNFHTEWKGIPDHISVELELMQRLTAREAQAWDESDTESTDRCLELEARFMQEHLAQWIHLFCDKVFERANFVFYKGMAQLTKDFIESEQEYLKTVTKPLFSSRHKVSGKTQSKS